MYYDDDMYDEDYELEIDFDRLRNDLANYYGSCMVIIPAASVMVGQILNSDYDELIDIARKHNIDLTNYCYIAKKM